jgi:hypothetical protein
MGVRTNLNPEPVERDRLAVRRAIGRLIQHLGDEDPTIVAKAAQALEEIGPFVVGPLIDALPRARSARLQLAIMGALLNYGHLALRPIHEALIGVLTRAQDPSVQAGALFAMRKLSMGQSTQSEVAAPAPGGPARTRSTSPG